MSHMIQTWERNGLSKITIHQIFQAKYSLHLVDRRCISRIEYLVHLLHEAVDTANAVLRAVLLDRCIPSATVSLEE